MKEKTEVRMIKDSGPNNMDKWEAGQTGYIDGYIGGGGIAVVIGKKIIICDTWDVEVITEYEYLYKDTHLTNQIGPR